MGTEAVATDPDAPADPIERELAKHPERDCPSCGESFLPSDGRVPDGGYQLAHCTVCAIEIESRLEVAGAGGL